VSERGTAATGAPRGRLLIGTSSWSDQKPLYPPGTKSGEMLRLYARAFPIVEVNTSYYHVPTREMTARWAQQTPSGFVFDVKPPRELTATPETPGTAAPEPDAATAEAFLDALQPLIAAGKMGAITFQFPPSYRNTDEHQAYVRLLPELFPGVALSVEFRRRDWLDEEHVDGTLRMLAECGLSYAMADEPQVGMGSVPPVYGVTNQRLAVIRFHGRNERNWYAFGRRENESRFDWDYSAAELSEWLPRIERARTEAAEVHVFFNTSSYSTPNALRLLQLLGLERPALPEFPVQRGLW
jgi:uncharacterized protein YecE (DUF72 family)